MLVLVVGPSGAGKDTLLRGARAALAGDARFVFPRRTITRPADADAEDHDTLSVAAFRDAAAAGKFALTWEAHGLFYGLPAAIADDIRAGRVVVINGSRAALARALAIFPDSRVVLVDATPAERARRLAARGRESAAEIAARIARETPQVPAGAVIVDNSGAPAAGIAALIAALTGFIR